MSSRDHDSDAGRASAEEAAVITRDALAGLEQLLTGQAHDEMIACDRVGAIVRLIARAAADAVR